MGSPDIFLTKYLAFRNQQLRKSGGSDVLTIPLGFVKGLSRSFTGIAGEASIDLQRGVVTANLNGLSVGTRYSVWLVDGRASDPEKSFEQDRRVKLGDVDAGRSVASVGGLVAGTLPRGFSIDRIIVAEGVMSADKVVASGSVNVFQKLFARRATLTNQNAGTLLLADQAQQAPAFASLVADVEAETRTAMTAALITIAPNSLARLAATLSPAVEAFAGGVPLDVLVKQGADLFFTKTFGGNGRTCGTCHPASNNLTIDTAFIATLPATDPLFVAEFNSNLALLERPALMRQFGLILENLDGLNDPANKFVMRGVPHTLAQSVSLQQDTSLLNGPAQMTGWSGDGAPGAGSLRDFAIGAVVQHFTQSLARNEGPDFHLPNEHQLDAMEAFQLSLGRATDFNLATMTFLDTNVEAGKSLFVNGTGDPNAGGRCDACHGNAGAIAANGQNRNFNTNVEDVFNPARAVLNFPIDGGFGQTPVNPDGSFGNRGFNTPSVVEAADTAPFFHNNVVTTLAGVLDFYTGPEFNNPRAVTARFSFSPTQKTNIANFMRAINTVDNINVAKRELQEILALNGNPQDEVASRLLTARSDTEDAIQVLTAGGIFPTAGTNLTSALQFIIQAQQTNHKATRNALIQQAITKLTTAKAAITP